MGVVDSVVAYFRSCGSFSGRASRAEYWRVMRIVLAIPVVLVVFGIVISSIQGGITGGSFGLSSLFGGIVLVIPVSVFFVLVLSPAWLSVTARRLHDTGRSARWLLVYAVIVLGWVAVAGIAAWVISELASQTSGDGYDVYAGLEWVLLILFVAGLWGVASLIGMIILFSPCASVGVAGPNRSPARRSSNAGSWGQRSVAPRSWYAGLLCSGMPVSARTAGMLFDWALGCILESP